MSVFNWINRSVGLNIFDQSIVLLKRRDIFDERLRTKFQGDWVCCLICIFDLDILLQTITRENFKSCLRPCYFFLTYKKVTLKLSTTNDIKDRDQKFYFNWNETCFQDLTLFILDKD